MQTAECCDGYLQYTVQNTKSKAPLREKKGYILAHLLLNDTKKLRYSKRVFFSIYLLYVFFAALTGCF